MARIGFLVRNDFREAGQFHESSIATPWLSIGNIPLISGNGSNADPDMTGEGIKLSFLFEVMVPEMFVSIAAANAVPVIEVEFVGKVMEIYWCQYSKSSQS